MSFVKCSVDGCCRKLQPILKVGPRDRDTWLYRECDVCLKPACEKHSAEIEGRIVCPIRRHRGPAAEELLPPGEKPVVQAYIEKGVWLVNRRRPQLQGHRCLVAETLAFLRRFAAGTDMGLLAASAAHLPSPHTGADLAAPGRSAVF